MYRPDRGIEMFRKMGTVSLALGSIGVMLLASPAMSVGVSPDATGNVSVGTQYGSTLRNQFRQNVDGTGYYWKTYGNGGCSSTTSDVDDSWADMSWKGGWDNSASWAADYNQCDTRLYRYANFGTELTSGWTNFGSGASLAAINDVTSSYKLS